MHDDRSDSDLIEHILSGDAQAVRVLVERHEEQAMTLAVRLLHNEKDAEEALQDAFVRALRALPRFQQRAQFRTWFYRIVYNVCLTRLSTLRSRVDLFDERTLAEVDSASDVSASDLVHAREESEAIHRAIQMLPAGYATVVTLYYLQEMSYDEIVQVTGMPVGTVKTHLFRARAMLKRILAKRLELESV